MKFLEKHPMIMIIIGVIGISLSAICVKFSDAPSVITAAYRLLWTVGLMTPFVISNRDVRQELKEIDKKTAGLCAISGTFLALHFTTWFESLNQTSVASSTAIVCTEVIWVALGVCLILKEKLYKIAIVSIAITLIGSILIAFSDYSSGGNHLIGDGLALAAAVFSAIYTLIGGKVRKRISTTSYTYIVYLFCAIVLCLATWGSGLSLKGHGTRPIIVGLLLSVFSTLLGHSIFSWCLKYLSPSFISASKLCEPAIAAIFAIFLFNEIPTLLQILGALLTLGGVLIYSKAEMAQSSPNT